MRRQVMMMPVTTYDGCMMRTNTATRKKSFQDSMFYYSVSQFGWKVDMLIDRYCVRRRFFVREMSTAFDVKLFRFAYLYLFQLPTRSRGQEVYQKKIWYRRWTHLEHRLRRSWTNRIFFFKVGLRESSPYRLTTHTSRETGSSHRTRNY